VNSPILVTQMAKEVSSSETSVLTRVTRFNISDDGFLHRQISVLHALSGLVQTSTHAFTVLLQTVP
jgi:hypothetical protein